MATDNHTYGFSKADAGALVQLIGNGDGEYLEGRVRGGGKASTKIVLTPGGGIAARSGTTVSSASCTEYKIVSGTLTTNTNSLTVYNIWPFAIPASMYIKATKESISGFWLAEHPGVVDVQWDDPDLEFTRDGSTWINIDTPEECP